MPPALTDQQRRLSHNILLFDRPLSQDVMEALYRASLASAENGLASTGLTEFFCGLFLQFRLELQVHFTGEVIDLVERTFPKHRSGDRGLVPESVIENAASDLGSNGMWSLSLSNDLIRLLFTAIRLANAVGRKTSLKDVIAAIALEDEWIEELKRNGITPRKKLLDFKDLLNVVCFVTVHANSEWPRTIEFEADEKIQPPFTALVKTPSGSFAPMNTAAVKLNGKQIAAVSWPDHPEVNVPIELQTKNILEFEVDGPSFGSMEVIIQGIRIRTH